MRVYLYFFLFFFINAAYEDVDSSNILHMVLTIIDLYTVWRCDVKSECYLNLKKSNIQTLWFKKKKNLSLYIIIQLMLTEFVIFLNYEKGLPLDEPAIFS